MRFSVSRRQKGFTVIELLVVLGIAAVLVGLLFPVLGRARSAAKAHVCRANMRALAQATTNYTLDYDLTYPQATQDSALTAARGAAAAGSALWYNALDAYLGQQGRDYSAGDVDERNYVLLKQDPAWFELEDRAPQGSADRVRQNTHTIKMNANFGAPGAGFAFVRSTDRDLVAPSQTALFVDGRGHDTPSVTTGSTAGANDFAASPGRVGLRHGGGANLARVDGSATLEDNPVNLTTAGFRAWHSDGSGSSRNWPESIFNFRQRRR